MNTMNKNLIQNLVKSFTKGDSTEDKVAKVHVRENLVLDKERKIAKTNKRGIANLNLRILTSKPGKYFLRFKSGNTYSDKTESFVLLNRILEVKQLRDLSANIKIPNLKGI